MGFKRAKAEQAKLKAGIYGQAGSGKTLTSLLLAEGLAKLDGRRVAFVDTERGTDFYTLDNEKRKLHPAGFDFDAIYTRSIYEVLQEIRGLPSDYGVLVIDSITHIWEAAMDAYSGPRTRDGGLPIQAWGKIKRPYKELMTLLINLPIHVIICGRQKNEYEDDEQGKMRKVGTTMRAEGDTGHEPHILIHAERLRSPQQGISLFFEKDRTSILSGRTVVLEENQPPGHTWKLIGEPLLAVLSGNTQAVIQDSDETAARDIDISTTEEAKKTAKAERLFRQHRVAMESANTKEALEQAAKGITPAVKKELSREQVAELKEIYLREGDRIHRHAPQQEAVGQ